MGNVKRIEVVVVYCKELFNFVVKEEGVFERRNYENYFYIVLLFLLDYFVKSCIRKILFI